MSYASRESHEHENDKILNFIHEVKWQTEHQTTPPCWMFNQCQQAVS